MAAGTPSLAAGDKKRWWLTKKQMAERYVRKAKILISSQDQSEIAAALRLLEAAVSTAPRMEVALEMKARCLLCLRRYKEVADMLQAYIPTVKIAISDDTSSSGSSNGSSTQLLKDRTELLLSTAENEAAVNCFSGSDLTKKVMARLCKNDNNEGQWRFSVLGQACYHLGLMEEAMSLFQTAKRLATFASRSKSTSFSGDIFSPNKLPSSGENAINSEAPKIESDTITHFINHIKLLLRRKATAVAALDAGHYIEATRHFSKILDGRRAAPQAFLSDCYVRRAAAYRSAGRIAEAISDCNKALALETSSIDALTIRATLFETIRCLPDSLHDLEHLKLLYNTILRDWKPVWKWQNVSYREIPGRLCSLASKMQQLKQSVAGGETDNVDYYALFGLRRGCSEAELKRVHLLLSLKHKSDKSLSFIDKCEFVDEEDIDSAKDRGRISALLLFRLIQKGYICLSAMISKEEAIEKQKIKSVSTLRASKQCSAMEVVEIKAPASAGRGIDNNSMINKIGMDKKAPIKPPPPASFFQGVFCRDLSVVGCLISHRPTTIQI